MKKIIYGCFILVFSLVLLGCPEFTAPTPTTTLPLHPTYTVIYNGNGNSGGSVPVDGNFYAYNQVVAVIGNIGNLTKVGFVFQSWNTKADGTGLNRSPDSFFAMGSSNVILYAIWAHTVTYDGNGNTGGSVPIDSTTYFEDAVVTVLDNTGTLTKTGYAFAGWNTEANGLGTDYAAASTLTMGKENITLYAKWYKTYYIVGDAGPAGGLVFYDKGYYSSGWQYLEVAPCDQSPGIPWYTVSRIHLGATATEIGSGSTNTATLVATQGNADYAAPLCMNLTLGGYDDWFLPSKDELDQMYHNLKEASLGDFASTWYWSSSESGHDYYGDYYVWGQNFSNGNQDDLASVIKYYVRAVRAF